MTISNTLACLAIVAIVVTIAFSHVASLPGPTTTIATTCDDIKITKPTNRKINKVIDGYVRHRAKIATAFSDCR